MHRDSFLCSVNAQADAAPCNPEPAGCLNSGIRAPFLRAWRAGVEDSNVTQTRRTFVMICRVEVNIRSSPERIWSLLTDAKDFPRWNSTVSSIEGRISEGELLHVRVPGSNRILKPKVSGVQLNERMTWTGGVAPIFKGVRTFNLISRKSGSTDFVMEERFSGLML